jgi:hypothetical protein
MKNEQSIVRAIVMELGLHGMAKVQIICASESPDGFPRRVLIQPGYHYTPVVNSQEAYGVEFGDKSGMRPPQLYDIVLLRRHHLHNDVASMWCYENDVMQVSPIRVVPVLKTRHGNQDEVPEIIQNLRAHCA